MAIDYGKKRTGIAVTDILQIIPNGLTTVATHELLNFLKAFAKQLEQHFPTIPITFYDERYTSTLAHQAMLAGGLGKKRRQEKALVDEISACIILQSYMESKKI